SPTAVQEFPWSTLPASLNGSTGSTRLARDKTTELVWGLQSPVGPWKQTMGRSVFSVPRAQAARSGLLCQQLLRLLPTLVAPTAFFSSVRNRAAFSVSIASDGYLG